MGKDKKDIVRQQQEKLLLLPLISEYASRSEWEDACWRKILASNDLLQSLVTPYERHNLVVRAAARDGLVAGKSYRKIGGEHWISPQTVSGIKKVMGGGNYQSYRQRSKRERKKRIYDTAYRPARPKRKPGIPRRTKYGVLHMPY